MVRARSGTGFQSRGVWYFEVRLRTNKRHRGRIPPRKGGLPITKAYAREYGQEMQARYDAGDWDPEAPPPVTREPGTVAAYAKDWVGKQTHRTAKQEARKLAFYVAPSKLGKMQLRAVRAVHVVDFLAELGGRKSRRGGKLAPRTIRNVHSILQRVFAYAEILGDVEVSPCARTASVLPAIRDKHPGARATWKFQRAEVERLISDERIPHDRRVLWCLLFLTGARFGEASALKWSDYERDLEPLGRLTLARSIDSLTREEGPTKTDAIKLVPVHPTLAAVLAEWRLSGFAAKMRRAPRPDDRIVPNKLGRPRGENSDNQMLARDCAKLGIDRRHLHCTRHTFIRLAQDDGARGEVLRWATHAPPPSANFDGYGGPGWASLCAEVAKLKIRRAGVNSLRDGLQPTSG